MILPGTYESYSRLERDYPGLETETASKTKDSQNRQHEVTREEDAGVGDASQNVQ